jgi:hypothetical protein
MATATKSRARRTGSDLLDQLQELSDPRLPGVSVRFEEITPELATKYRALVPERQRALSEESSDQYSGDMAGLDWEFDGNTIVFNALGELVNGQHRMKAIEDSGIPQVMLVVRGVTLSAIEVMDTNRIRSFADMLRMRGVPNHPAVSALTKRILHWQRGNYATRGVPRVEDAAYVYTTQSNKVLWKTFRQYEKDIHLAVVEGAGVIRRGRFVKNTAPPSIVHFAWLLLRRIDLDSAESFFHELSEGPASNDHAYPIRRLQLKLQTKPAPGDEGIPDWVWLHYFCQAWNAWLDGRSVGNLRRPSPVRYDTVAKPLDILADDRPAGWEPL